MEIIITLILIILALSILLGKPIQIIITLKHATPPAPAPAELDAIQKQNDEDSKAIQTMDAVIKTIHNIMGVNTDGDDNKQT